MFGRVRARIIKSNIKTRRFDGDGWIRWGTPYQTSFSVGSGVNGVSTLAYFRKNSIEY